MNSTNSNSLDIISENKTFGHISALDGLRGVAVLAVIFYHLGYVIPEIKEVSSGGFFGVQLFFVLSGFLITSILLKEIDGTSKINLKNFYWRRTLRLVPAFWAYLIFLYFTLPFFQPTGAQGYYEGNHFLYAFLYVSNWDVLFAENNGFYFVHLAWSLSIEEQFYIVWSAAMWVMVKQKAKIETLFLTTAAVVLFIVIERNFRALSGESLDNLYYGTDTRIDAILIGCVAAFIYAKQRIVSYRYFNILAIISLVAIIAIFATSNIKDVQTYTTGFPIFSISTAVLIVWIASRKTSIFHKILENRVLRYVGEISYGLYLWNMLAIHIANMEFDSSITKAIAGTILTFGFAALSYTFIEKPFLKMKG